VHAICEFHGLKFSVPPTLWTNDGRIRTIRWEA
jgi:hypothetical protein